MAKKITSSWNDLTPEQIKARYIAMYGPDSRIDASKIEDDGEDEENNSGPNDNTDRASGEKMNKNTENNSAQESDSDA